MNQKNHLINKPKQTNMKVVCLNKNGWHWFEGNLYGFLAPRPSEARMDRGEIHDVEGMLLDVHGDLLYVINGIGWEAEQFSIIDGLFECEIDMVAAFFSNPK